MTDSQKFYKIAMNIVSFPYTKVLRGVNDIEYVEIPYKPVMAYFPKDEAIEVAPTWASSIETDSNEVYTVENVNELIKLLEDKDIYNHNVLKDVK